MISRRICLLLLAALALTLQAPAADRSSGSVHVYAAASLANALDDIAATYQRDTGRQLTVSYAASSTLARQIEAGARADVFVSADNDWMDYLQNRELIDSPSRVKLLGNRLVLIAPADSALTLAIGPGFALSAALGDGRLSVADPDSVPAGKYARSALMSLGVWSEVSDRLVRGDNVRTALAFVARGECPLGIVYETDALGDRKVRIVATFPAGTHAPIVYPAALTRAAQPEAREFLEYLRGPAAEAVFKDHGFRILP